MKKHSLETSFWSVIFVGLSAFSAWQVYQNRQLASQFNHGEEISAGQKLLEDFARTRAYELSLEERELIWPPDMERLGADESEPENPDYRGPRLLLAVDEVSCTTCRDEQTAFALEIARAVGPEALRIVVRATEPRFARSYMRLNQVHIPVHYDAAGALFEANQLSATPVLLLLDETGKIVMAHYPTPDKPILSQPFHQKCRQLFLLP